MDARVNNQSSSSEYLAVQLTQQVVQRVRTIVIKISGHDPVFCTKLFRVQGPPFNSGGVPEGEWL